MGGAVGRRRIAPATTRHVEQSGAGGHPRPTVLGIISSCSFWPSGLAEPSLLCRSCRSTLGSTAERMSQGPPASPVLRELPRRRSMGPPVLPTSPESPAWPELRRPAWSLAERPSPHSFQAPSLPQRG
jgi:hypothetical protein